MHARVAWVLALAVAALVVPAACDDATVPEPCRDIPAGGCPTSYGVACEDPACEAVYACRPGNVWELQKTCPVREAGAPQDASNVDVVDAAAPSFDASIDAPPGAFGGPGCETLQLPDCALGLVLGCGGCCGCEDLFVCQNEGWSLWGTCADGVVHPDP